ncbi:MAG: hypothetical protein KKA26_00715, partial [Nanoarchaeota archaeon]|nr:hypothetical protein [Nanoarchaeota archaeon]
LQNQISSIETTLVNTQARESKLRDEISRLVANEDGLNKRKGNVQSRILRLKEKLGKINKIKDEIKEV